MPVELTPAPRILKKTLTLAAAVLTVLILAPYAWSPIYNFPDPEGFRGAHFWNPYAATTANWKRANFHAHGRAWIGLTSGEQSDFEVVRRYRELGYDIPCVSNYQQI